MFIIYGRQLQQLQTIIDDKLERSVFETIRQHHAYAVEGLEDSQIRSRVRNGIRLARESHMKSGRGITTFVAYMFAFAPNFHWHPKIREILSQADAPDQIKLDRITKTMTQADWEEIDEAYEEDAWLL